MKMARPMIALALVVLLVAVLSVIGIHQTEAKQVAEKPVISEKRASIPNARCVASGALDRRISWVVRAADGSVKSFGFVVVRKCSW